MQKARPLQRYRIAGHVFDCDLRTPLLDGFAVAAPAMRPPGGGSFDRDFPVAVFAGRNQIAGAEREVECRWGDAGYRLSVADVGEFLIAPDGASILVREATEGSPEDLFQTLVGPLLIVAMAARGTFCLHASAVALDGRAVVFMGCSGAGKSTLAAALPSLATSRWRRVADDLLPISRSEGEGRVVCRSDFPQLKLDPSEQAALSPPRLPVSEFYLLRPPPPPGSAEILFTELDSAAAALALVSQGVATRLFAQPLLAEHFAFSAAVATGPRVCELRVPWSQAALPRLARILEERMAAEA